MGDTLPWTPMNTRHAKCDAASFILGKEIRNHTNKQTHKQTVNDISTLCLLARVDNKCISVSFCCSEVNGPQLTSQLQTGQNVVYHSAVTPGVMYNFN